MSSSTFWERRHLKQKMSSTLARTFAEGASIHCSSISVDRLDSPASSFTIRCRYASKFGGQTAAGEEGDLERKNALQKAFNSPFRPLRPGQYLDRPGGPGFSPLVPCGGALEPSHESS